MNRLLIAAALGALVSAVGCATAPAPASAPETVGTLTPSETHVATAAVHATTDLTPSYAPASADDEDEGEPATVTAASPPPTWKYTWNDVKKEFDEAPPSNEVPAVVEKTDGVTIGGGR